MAFWKKKKKIEKIKIERCEMCNGSGRLTRDIHKWSIPGNRNDSFASTCYKCKGSGKIRQSYFE